MTQILLYLRFIDFGVTEVRPNDLLYLATRGLARSGEVYDGAKQRVHLNLRSLTRMLQYVKLMLPMGYAVHRCLFEGACMVNPKP